MDISLLPVITMSFALGTLHALDADHVMAVTALSNTRPSLLTTVRFSICWALGHGTVLILLLGLLVLFGIHIPAFAQQMAEVAVGVMLIIMGFWCFWRLRSEKLILHKHRHGEVTHCHWQKNDEHSVKKHKQQTVAKAHTPVLVGMLHGVAGSAAALALIPVMMQGRFIPALLYMGVFSLGVLCAMLAFALGWGRMQQLLSERYQRLFEWNRQVIAAASVFAGVYWLHQAT